MGEHLATDCHLSFVCLCWNVYMCILICILIPVYIYIIKNVDDRDIKTMNGYPKRNLVQLSDKSFGIFQCLQIKWPHLSPVYNQRDTFFFSDSLSVLYVTFPFSMLVSCLCILTYLFGGIRRHVVTHLIKHCCFKVFFSNKNLLYKSRLY